MKYEFLEVGELSSDEVASKLKTELLGRVAVCTSFDSGRFVEPTWDLIGSYYVSPPISEAMIDAWPSSGYCDEWWIFDAEIQRDFDVVAFCNYVGIRISDYRDLEFDGGCQLEEYLAKFLPALVFGNNEYAYVIRRI